jgi:hypothetical protein
MPKIGSKLGETLKGQVTDRRRAVRTEPLWEGPEKDGITFSLLSRFLVCRERFRLLVVEGLRSEGGFNHRLEYGSMWHVCEEALASERRHFGEVVGTTLAEDNLLEYAKGLCRKYPTQQNEIDKWYRICKLQFPIYVKYWSKQKDVISRTPLLQEYAFAVPYRLPSGRTVLLRGKFDSVDAIGTGRGAGVYLQENKSKGMIVEAQIKRQVTFDLQTMLYLVALYNLDKVKVLKYRENGIPLSTRIAGIRYNVVRRPLSGGKGSITRKKPTAGAKCPKCKGSGIWPTEPERATCPKCLGAGRVNSKPGESLDEYYARVAKYIEKEPETYFMRWKIEVSQAEVERFRRECLDPILEQLCDWWEWITGPNRDIQGPFIGSNLHWRHPYGVWNVLDEGGSSDLDEYLATGSEIGLSRTENLFPELTEV